MSKLRDILIEIEKEEKIMEKALDQMETLDFQIREEYVAPYLIGHILWSFEEKCFDKGNFETLESKELLPGIDEQAELDKLIYILYLQAKTGDNALDPLSKYINEFIINIFVIAAMLYLTNDETEFLNTIDGWNKSRYSLIGAYEIAELVHSFYIFSEQEILAEIKETMEREMATCQYSGEIDDLL